jgi:hypothetical protein
MEIQIMGQSEFDNIMSRIRRLAEYEVQVTVPDDFQFYGEVPFDMNITKGTAWVRVIAESMEEAKFKVHEYFEGKYK